MSLLTLDRPVAGTRADILVPSSMNLSQEVKFIDTAVLSAGATTRWNYISVNTLFAIAQGTGNSNRVGRSIRVVGIVLRANVRSLSSTTNPTVRPYTIDVLLDRHADGVLPAVSTFYTPVVDAANGARYSAIPDPLCLSRIKWLKRVQRDPKHVNSTVNIVIPMDELVTYGGADPAATYPTKDLYVTFCPDAYDPVLVPDVLVAGRIRVLYVDA